MNKAIIFDWSGTLRNNCDCFYNVCNIMFKELGKKPISKEEMRMNFTLPYMKFWNKYFPDLTKEKQGVMFEKYIHQVGESEMYPNVKEILTSLYKKNGKCLFLAQTTYLN
jgi:phosphoglycolate phosphatase-like HAD superfamily hydrolase